MITVCKSETSFDPEEASSPQDLGFVRDCEAMQPREYDAVTRPHLAVGEARCFLPCTEKCRAAGVDKHL